MNNKSIIIVNSKEEATTLPYNGLESLQRAVGGYIEHFYRMKFRGKELDDNLLTADLWCDEEFLLKETDDDKINAFASLISDQEIRGNIAITVALDGGESRGFKGDENEGECAIVIEAIKKFCEENSKDIKQLHEKYDSKKREPFFEFRPYER